MKVADRIRKELIGKIPPALVNRIPREEDFKSTAHDVRVTSRIGLWLGIAFLACMVTGLFSHLIQHPPEWFTWPARPVWLYQVNQGVHVLSGVAAVPLLLAKVWSVYPKLFARPALRSVTHAAERIGILVLVAAAFFELATGLMNVTGFYPWTFIFPTVHYAVAWIVIGALAIHIGAKVTIIRSGLRTAIDAPAEPPKSATNQGLFTSRRAFLRTTGLAAGVAVVATAGVTVSWLRPVSVLGWRSGTGPQGVPINRTAAEAGLSSAVSGPDWRLELVGPSGTKRLSLADLNDLDPHDAHLPIACVEGWSAWAHWTGIRIADLAALVGGTPRSTVLVTSMEAAGPYRTSTLPPTHTSDPSTLLALRLNGETLTPDHGFPCRVIAPSRPGVLQTKWVHRLEVRP